MKKTTLKADKLNPMYIAVWRSNRWPWIHVERTHRAEMFVSTSREAVEEDIQIICPELRRKLRIVKYVPARGEKP